jgi:uroporphyrinogen III methyltransferase/synthase
VTRAQAQAQEFVSQLEELGAEALCVPTIEIVPPPSWAPLDLALRDLDECDILIFTSVNGVDAFFERLLENNQYYGVLTSITVVAVGPQTAAALKRNFISADLVATDHRAEGVLELLLQHDVQGKKILYPRAEVVRPLLIDSLKAAGATVVAPVAYRTVMPQGRSDEIRELLVNDKLDAICFSSSSTFKNLLTMLGPDSQELLKRTRLFSIGPQTSETIRKSGFPVDLEPQQWTIDSLIQAMINYYQ